MNPNPHPPTIDCSHTIARIVLDHPATARVFQAQGIDFCCRGDVTVDVACAERNLDPVAVCEALRAAVAEGEARAADDVRALSTAALTARIVDRHHGYLRRVLPWLVQLSNKVARVHGAGDERLLEVRDLVAALEELLIPHLDQEEEVLFPALVARAPDRALVERELLAMRAEHEEVGARLARLRRLTDDYAAPTWACTSYRTLLADLLDLETDLLRHVHLENHALLPRFLGSPAAR